MGKMIIIRTTDEVEEVAEENATLERIQKEVGGYIQQVPMWDEYEGEHCQVWCNEEGKMHRFLMDNNLATKLWYKAAPIMRGTDYLVGDIVILTGSAMLD